MIGYGVAKRHAATGGCRYDVKGGTMRGPYGIIGVLVALILLVVLLRLLGVF